MYIPFGAFRPDISDFRGDHSIVLNNVLPRADGYGPLKDFSAISSALTAACRGAFMARKTDGSVAIFAATADRISRLDNSTYSWVPVSKVAAVSSITNASPAVVNYNSHGFVANDPVVFSTSNTLPTGLIVGTVYYVSATGLGANAFSVSATPGGTRINTSGAGSGTHSVTAIYASIPATDQWQFAQFGNLVIAVQANVAPQVYDLSSSTDFGDLGGSPPQARYAAVVGKFLVLSGLTSNPFRVHWSGLNAVTTWTSGTNSSDYQDFADGGVVRTVAGGETGYIFQDGAIRRMTYAPGSPIIFQIDRVTRDMGIAAPLSLITANDKVYFYATQGFHSITSSGTPQPIGREYFDATFKVEFDAGNLQLMQGVADPRSSRVFWAYKTTNGASGVFNKLLCYDSVLSRATTASVTGEYILSTSQPGVTLESLDSISSSIDSLTQSLDSFASASAPEVGVFNSSHVLGALRGSNLEATLETPEKSGDGDSRIYIRGVRPIGDAQSVYASLTYRETQQQAAATSSESAVNAIGYCPHDRSTRYARSKIRIPAAASWSFIAGVDADVVPDGEV